MKFSVFCTVLLVAGALSVDIPNPLDEILQIIQSLNLNERDLRFLNDRDGKILASNSMKTKDNTAFSLPKLDMVIEKIGILNDKTVSLLGSQTTTESEVIALLKDVVQELGPSGSLKNVVGLIVNAISSIFTPILDPSSDISSISLMTRFIKTVDRRLGIIERTLAYENFPLASPLFNI